VKGVVPVKFMARKELVDTLNKKSARNPAIPLIADAIISKMSIAKTVPVMIPFKANSLDGIKGSRTGVMKAPESIPAARAKIETMPLSRALEKEKIPGPKPEMMNRTSAVISAGFSTI